MGRSGSVRAMISPMSLYWAPDVQTFWPVMRHSSPSRIGPGLQAGQVAAGAGLGEQLAADGVAAVHGREVRVLGDVRAVGQDRRGDHAQADREEALVGDGELRLQGVVGPLVRRRELAAAELGRAGDPAEAVARSAWPATPGPWPATSARSRRSRSSNIATLSEPSPHTKAASSAFSSALALRKLVTSAWNSSMLITPPTVPNGSDVERPYRARAGDLGALSRRSAVSDRFGPHRSGHGGSGRASASRAPGQRDTARERVSRSEHRWRRVHELDSWARRRCHAAVAAEGLDRERSVRSAKGGRTTSHLRRAVRSVGHHRRHRVQLTGSASHDRPGS